MSSDHMILVDGEPWQAPDLGVRLIDWLRDGVGCNAVKEGCGAGDCGACVVLVDDRPYPSCCTITAAVLGRQVWTASGLARTPHGRDLIGALERRSAFQCGFCAPGMFVSALAWLRAGWSEVPDRAAVAAALSGNLCRCTGYQPIIDAVLDVAQSARVGQHEGRW